MILIITLFAVAAVFGLSLLVPVLQGKTPSRPFVFVHGGIAAVALAMLILQYFRESATVPVASIALFVVAAIGGFILFARDLGGKPLPKGLALIHAGIAVAAFLVLLLSVI